MPCNCASVPFLHMETKGPQAWDANAFHTVAAGPVIGLRIVMRAII
jgi:hypothetical protein